MYNVIAPSFFQRKQCHLPGIGSLFLITHPAQTDFVNAQIKAPVQEIKFTAVADDENIFNEFSAISELMKRTLDEERTVVLDGVGTFTKDGAGDIHFAAIHLDAIYTPPVTAGRVIRQDSQHNILVGDRETNSTVMTEFFNDEEVVVKNRWWVWAIALGAAAIAVLSFYFYTNGWNGLGNVIGYAI